MSSLCLSNNFTNNMNQNDSQMVTHALDLLSPHPLITAAKSFTFTFSADIPIEPLYAQRSTAVTTGFFAINIIKKIEKGNNLDLSKTQIEKQNIGRGRMAFVHYAKYNGTDIALKKYKFKQEEFNDDTLSQFENELHILQTLKHNNITTFFGYHLNISKKVLSFAFEYCHHGNLFQMIHPIGNINESNYSYNKTLNILLDIAKGMKYLHSKHVIHRDLNPKNILLFDNCTKITDFGESIMIDDNKDFEQATVMDSRSIGTAGYKAPEMIKIGIYGYNYKIDVFSFGSLCYELLTRKFVSGQKYLTHYNYLYNGEHCLLIPEDCPEQYGSLLYDSWKLNVSKRPNFKNIVQRLELMIESKQ
eukprot:341608_1